MKRLARGTGRSKAVWEIEVVGRRWTIRYGKASADPDELDTYSREAASPAQAVAKAEELVAQRIADGYHVVQDAPVAEPAPPPTPLELELRTRPDDRELALVYADSRIAADDPRGPLIVLQDRIERSTDKAERAALGAEEHAWIAAHRDRLLGPLARADVRAVQVAWRRGFLSFARLAGSSDGVSGTAWLSRLCDLPDAAFVERLVLGLPDHAGGADFSETLECLVGNAARLPRLRELVVGDFDIGGESEMSWVSLGELAPLWPAFPQLETLEVQGNDFTLGAIAAPNLRAFELRTSSLGGVDAAAIADATWPALEKLVVWVGDPDFGGDADVDDLARILDGIPRVTHLGFCNTVHADAICERLGAIAPRLERLDLSRSTLSDDGAERLLALPLWLASLDISETYVSPALRDRLAAIARDLVATDLREGDRYVAITE